MKTLITTLKICANVKLIGYKDNSENPLFILNGPPGTGKKTLAQSFAKSLDRHFISISMDTHHHLQQQEPFELLQRTTDDILNDIRAFLKEKFTHDAPLSQLKRSNPGLRFPHIKRQTQKFIVLLHHLDRYNDILPVPSLTEVIRNPSSLFENALWKGLCAFSDIKFVATANRQNHIWADLRSISENKKIKDYNKYEIKHIVEDYMIPMIQKSFTVKLKKLQNHEEILKALINVSKIENKGLHVLEEYIITIFESSSYRSLTEKPGTKN